MHHHKAKPRAPKPLVSVGWVKRRARALMRFYGLLRPVAVSEAISDYQGLHGLTYRNHWTLS